MCGEIYMYFFVHMCMGYTVSHTNHCVACAILYDYNKTEVKNQTLKYVCGTTNRHLKHTHTHTANEEYDQNKHENQTQTMDKTCKLIMHVSIFNFVIKFVIIDAEKSCSTVLFWPRNAIRACGKSEKLFC